MDKQWSNFISNYHTSHDIVFWKATSVQRQNINSLWDALKTALYFEHGCKKNVKALHKVDKDIYHEYQLNIWFQSGVVHPHKEGRYSPRLPLCHNRTCAPVKRFIIWLIHYILINCVCIYTVIVYPVQLNWIRLYFHYSHANLLFAVYVLYRKRKKKHSFPRNYDVQVWFTKGRRSEMFYYIKEYPGISVDGGNFCPETLGQANLLKSRNPTGIL